MQLPFCMQHQISSSCMDERRIARSRQHGAYCQSNSMLTPYSGVNF
jgi:hypothetical protein